MPGRLEGKTIAILATDGFEQSELLKPREALLAEGARVEIVTPGGGEIQGFDHFDKGEAVKVDVTLQAANPDRYDALVLPGGAHNPDQLRINEEALDFVRAFFEAGKPAGAICHAPWILINAGVARGRRLTSYKTIRQDLEDAGADVVDEEVVVDQGLVTSRQPDDLPAFCAKLIEEIAEGSHEGRTRRASAGEEPRALH